MLKYLKNLSRRNKKFLYGCFLLISDLIFLVASFYLAYYIRFQTNFFQLTEIKYTINVHYISYSILFIVLNLIFFKIYKLYDWDQIYKGSGYYFRIFKAISINIIIIIIVGYLLETFSFSRIWITLLYVLGIVFLFFSRFIIKLVTERLVRVLGLSSRTVIIGIGECGRRIEDTLIKNPQENYRIIGYIDTEDRINKDKSHSNNFLILGFLKDLREVIQENNVRKIIISSREYKYFEILNILEELKGLDILVLMFEGFFEFSIRRFNMREVGGIPLIQISNIGFYGINLFYKKLLDYILGGVILLLFIPVYLIVGFLIKIDSKGPVIYKQERYTKDFKKFNIYKFRTMYFDAEDRLIELKKQNEADGPIFKIKEDPRITRVGRLLRRFSIDELPQIINVIKGDISLVGPRPPIPEEVGQYKEWHKKRLNVKQGVTGLWQVSGRSDLSFEEMVKLDLYYIQNWSIGMDLKIILRTIPTVLFSKGAY
jgi:exopolysaccharide biosynthesis polyprenyl glycosylphosphotransferase